jgi:pimeloyl-ACP methyl ester carboxylesterase
MLFFQLPLLPEWWLTKNEGANLVRLFRASFRRPHEPPAEILEASRRALLEPGAARAAIAYYRHAARGPFHPLHLRALRASYAPIRVPVSILWGLQDSALGESLLEGSERFAPDLEVHRIPDAGHFVHQEQPDTVNRRLLAILRPSTDSGSLATRTE